jgi:hypothetical protein
VIKVLKIKKDKKKPKKKEVEKELGKMTCTSCDKTLTETAFYMSKSWIYRITGRLSICKTCVGELYDLLFAITNSYKISMYRLCRKLDVPYIHAVYDMAERESNKRNNELYRMYFQKINSLGTTNNYCGDFDDSDDFEQKAGENINDVEVIKKEIMSDFELTADMVLFWGEGIALSDYKYLEDQYSAWKTRSTIDSKSLEDLIKQVCFQDLIIKQKRKSKTSVDKDLKVWQDLLTACNLKPVQDSSMNSVEQSTFGTLIKTWENERPISKPDPEWEDVDKVTKYHNIWFKGHTAEMFGEETDVTNEYREELEKYTVTGTETDGD